MLGASFKQNQLALSKLEKRTRGLKPKKKTPLIKNSPNQELDLIPDLWPNIHRPASTTKAYQGSAQVVSALIWGAVNVLEPWQITKIRLKMEQEFGAKTTELFLTKRFTEEERADLYLRLHNSIDPLYGGNGKRISLADAMMSFQGFSRLLTLWLRPPTINRKPHLKFDSDFAPLVQEIQELCREKLSRYGGDIRKDVMELFAWFKEEKKTWDSDMLWHWRFFDQFVRYLIEVAEDTGERWPGAFNPRNPFVIRTLKNMKESVAE